MIWRLLRCYAGYLFNDPLEDTEMINQPDIAPSQPSYLFNDPLEDTEICLANDTSDTGAVTCSTIR